MYLSNDERFPTSKSSSKWNRELTITTTNAVHRISANCSPLMTTIEYQWRAGVAAHFPQMLLLIFRAVNHEPVFGERCRTTDFILIPTSFCTYVYKARGCERTWPAPIRLRYVGPLITMRPFGRGGENVWRETGLSTIIMGFRENQLPRVITEACPGERYRLLPTHESRLGRI